MSTPQQNRRIRRQIAKEIDKLYKLFEKRDKKACPMVGFEQAFGEFGDFLLDTDIRYYEEDEIAPISKAAKV